MNKTALKKFATEARVELLEKVELQARKLGITAESIQKANVESSDAVFIDGKQLSDTERQQRNKLIARINEIGFERVMEETAYTWFNRFIALRYMEVNEYLPTKVRVLSSNSGSAEPDMMKEALSLDLDLDKEKVYDMKMNNETDDLFKYLIKMHCNDLNRYMPFMFETIEDYTEILFPEGLLGTDSFVRQMTDTEVIPEDNWTKVEIIGWLYQYYIAEEKDRVILAKKKYKNEEIPFATQLFTPEWIVRYMVQNALGRYWVESHSEHRGLIENWEFYLENPNPEVDFEEKLAPYVNKELNVEDIKCFDPAMGSGHILVYMFDVLHEIYSQCGYTEREIPRLIIEKNLYGLDIDDRAYQLASFSVVMKAMQYNKRFMRSIEREGLVLNLASIQETNKLTDEEVAFLAGEHTGEKFDEMQNYIEQFKHAKAIGSLLKLESYDTSFLHERLTAIEQQVGNLFELEMKDRTLELFRCLIKQSSLMDQKYDVFITNPPYAGNRYLSKEVTTYLNANYPNVKSDLYSAFMEYSFRSTKPNGQLGFITPFVWMFISSYEHIRNIIVKEKNISSLIQLEYNGFEAAMVPVCLFTLRNYHVDVSGEFIKLSDFTGIENQPIKTLEAVQNPSVSYRYSCKQNQFSKISGSPIAYWVSDKVRTLFENSIKLGEIASPRKGNSTSNNNLFLRLWHEVDINTVNFNKTKIVKEETKINRWFPYNKGGGYRKWYGNNEYLIDWKNDAEEIRKIPTAVIANYNYFMKPGLTWSTITSSNFSIRKFGEGFIFDNGGCCLYTDENERNYFLSLLNSSVFKYVLGEINPTLNFQSGEVAKFPVVKTNIETMSIIDELTNENYLISKKEWDSIETSWDFQKHPLIMYKRETSIESTFKKWKIFMEEEFNQLKLNEEELNRIFIEIYGLQDELEPKVEDKDITIRKADLEQDIKSFISYAIGCSFGRYSLDEDSLIYAGGGFDFSRYQTFPADEDNILPILPGAYFEDDIVTRFIDFVRITFSEETLEENLDFVADAIGRRKNETSREVLRRYFLNDFYKDHLQVYKKRPIYWLFTSGREKAFNCLIYMHRYDKTTLSRIRTDYLHEVQTRLDAEKNDLLEIINGDSTTREINNAKRELKSLDRKIDELKAYDELLHHMADMQIEIDLDDGVKVNYEKFKGLVAKI
ncbi:BREX-1 system adenine-specific DNA-methyltransferase PglX [Sporosarcina ureae]|uniref:BREX-1 system adenine-specific DNA-methyltransferase PglX n=1 Tax=Sporosarcina ureae TaxID=1571 RepID=UPI0009DC7AC8|nr:BREX-1 system adenine-specific DNA-methyltransferase PglX [Sporosarcina ureae]ARF16732.1 restriction endonuclease [Sporosarcina ureae]